MASIPLPSYLTKKDIQALMEACIRFYAIELLGEGYQGYLVTSWQIPHLGYKWKSSLGFFRDISQITGQDNIKRAYDVLAGWEKEAPDVLSAPIETQEVSETVPRNLNELVEALQKAKSQEEKSALIRNYQAFKAAAPVPPAAPVAEAAAAEGVGIKITPEALKFFEQSLAKTTEAPFKLVTFFSSPKFLSETPQAKRALTSSVSLPKIAKRAEGLPESERRRLLEFVENLRQAEFSFFAQTKLSRRIFSVQEITILMGPEVGLGQGEVAALIQGGAPPGKRPSLLGRLFGGIAQRAISKTATKAVTSALTKAGISITTKTIAGGIGTAIGGPIGTVLGLVVGWVIDKVLGPLINKITDFISQNKWVLASPFVVAGLILGLPWLTVGGLVMGGLLLAGGVGPALSSAAAGAPGVLTGILSLTVASIATPLIVALISIPVIVALILFIINSGAYVVPPSESLVSESPYIRVEKRVSPEGPFKNSDLAKPLIVEYTVTITAKKGALENIRLEYECEVIKKEGAALCPPIEPSIPKPEDEDYPKRISPLESYAFSYSARYDSQKYFDSAVIDTITVTANVAEKKDAKESGSAAIIIGDAPTGCFVFEGDWPADARAQEMAAIAKIARAQTFMAQLCSQGEIKLDHEPQVARWGGWTKGYRYIVIYPLGVYTHASAVYTLAHESGHVLAQVTSLYNKYIDTPGLSSERPLCTYPLSVHPPSEDFAEMIALYLSRDIGQATSRFSCLEPGNFKTKYPNHWGFARNSIFLENLGW